MVTIEWLGPELATPMSVEEWLRCGYRYSFSCGRVAVRQFGATDSRALYEIRNHPSVLPFMPSALPMALERHDGWVQEHVLTPGPASPLLLLGFEQSRPVGFCMIKAGVDAGAFELGVMVIGELQGGGLAARLGTAAAAIAAGVFGANELLTHVNPAHETALRFNRGMGLRDAPSAKPGELCLRAPVSQALATPLYLRCTRELRIHAQAP